LPFAENLPKLQLLKDPLTANMNVSEAMKLKTKIKNISGIDLKMLDIPDDGLVLYIERKALDVSSYKLLADFTAQNDLSLQLDLGNFIISTHPLPPH
jgi:hypothetical protein